MTEREVKTVRSFCRICTAVCGILVDVSGDRIVRVRGDRRHPLSQATRARRDGRSRRCTTTRAGWNVR